MIDAAVNWPGDARCGVMLTFDFDAESLWLGRDPDNAERMGTLSQGAYGARVGVPSILRVLEEKGVKATFFVPGWTADHHPGRVEMIHAAGHEIGHHSYSHCWVKPGEDALEAEELDRGLEALDRLLGIRPSGYRSPAGETSQTLFRMLAERGFAYDSSLMTSINPYYHAVGGNAQALVELPWHWSLDDAVFALFSIRNPRAIMTNDHIFTVWADEFDAIYQAGGLFDLVMHPQVIGRPSRLVLLRRMIEHIQKFPGVAFLTGHQANRAFRETYPAQRN